MTDAEHPPLPNPENRLPPSEASLVLLEFPKFGELAKARQIVLELLGNPEIDPAALQSAWMNFADAIELIVENPELDQHMHSKLQIGAIVYKALLFKDAGNQIRYAQELSDAELYAHHEGLLEVSLPLKTELTAVIEALPLDAPEIIVLKLRETLDDADLLTLQDSIDDGDDFDDILGTAYYMIEESGLNPDETLRLVGLIE